MPIPSLFSGCWFVTPHQEMFNNNTYMSSIYSIAKDQVPVVDWWVTWEVELPTTRVDHLADLPECSFHVIQESAGCLSKKIELPKMSLRKARFSIWILGGLQNNLRYSFESMQGSQILGMRCFIWRNLSGRLQDVATQT